LKKNIEIFYNITMEEVIKEEVIKEEVIKEEVIKEEVIKEEVIKETSVKESTKNSNQLFEPKQTDSIYWCVFLYVYGYAEYSMIGSKYGNRELDEKQKMISFFKENPKALKTINYKITNSNIQEIYSEYLSFQNETTLLGVIGLVVFYNIRILLVDTSKKTYLDYNTNNMNNKICVLFKNTCIRNRTKYTFDMYMTDEKIQTIQKSMLCLEHFNKPLRSISTYKMSELEDITKLLGIYNDNSQKKLKKQELYNNISEYCGVF